MDYYLLFFAKILIIHLKENSDNYFIPQHRLAWQELSMLGDLLPVFLGQGGMVLVILCGGKLGKWSINSSIWIKSKFWL